MVTVAAILACGWSMMERFRRGPGHQSQGGRAETLPASSPSRRPRFGSLGFKVMLMGTVLGMGEVLGEEKLVRPKT